MQMGRRLWEIFSLSVSDMTGYSQSCQAETDHLVCLDMSSDLVVVSSETLVIK